jgi:endonuclease/exonuclease/phosphatase family metal-dependent hydrolase
MIRIATWNVQRPKLSEVKRRDGEAFQGNRLLESIQAMQADIWILTETHASLSPGLEFTSTTTEESDPIHEPGETWVTIWSRFPIELVTRTSDPSRACAARIVPNGSRPLVVYGTVLPWIGSTWQGIPSANGAAFSAALNAQLSDWVSLQREHPDCDFVLAGDFNQDMGKSHYYGSRRNQEALQSAIATARLRCLTAAGLDPVLKHAPSHASIDHICASAGLILVGSPVSWPISDSPQKRLSDHFGVLVELAGA